MKRQIAPILRHKVKPASLRLGKAQLIPTLIFLALLVAFSGLVFSQVRSVDFPENASAKRYGTGWECNRGYRKADHACVAVDIPANAYATDASYGRGWECSRGYRRTHQSCVVIKLPPNAYLNSTRGDTWKCKRGYRPVDDECFIINVPRNGYLMGASYGPGWKCDRGERAVKEACVALQVPDNAHISISEHNWECNRPYHKQQNGCVLRRGVSRVSFIETGRLAHFRHGLVPPS